MYISYTLCDFFITEAEKERKQLFEIKKQLKEKNIHITENTL